MTASLELDTINMFQNAMSGASRRHDVLSHNLANVNTPRYKRQDVAFKQQLREKYLATDSAGQISSIGREGQMEFEPFVYQTNDRSMRNDQNNVDLDRESAELAKNSLYYGGLSRMLRQQFQSLNQLLGGLE